ncbi:J domain-containing protein [Pseudomaricurvus alkylphenolicus]|uniref:J domain-containing protein n=1 Tax=Pseudomaricurvus alkylphenolicus TaxID=1306991 RepID=UPI00141E6BA5|nr:J domain-containing protein [Pseudomaricurvus alkylphenolicus]NIB39591.1 J domain-containing protein [Pseudomaricurvus alkylphenolicus]
MIAGNPSQAVEPIRKDAFTTHYHNLRVSQSASADEIRRAYKQLCQKHHPDKAPGDERQVRRFQCIHRAYSVLSDEHQRRLHDQWIERRRRRCAPTRASIPSRALPGDRVAGLPNPTRKANLQPYREVLTTLEAHRRRLSETARQRALRDVEVAEALSRQQQALENQTLVRDQSLHQPLTDNSNRRLVMIVAGLSFAVLALWPVTGTQDNIDHYSPSPSVVTPAVSKPVIEKPIEPLEHSDAWVAENIF